MPDTRIVCLAQAHQYPPRGLPGQKGAVRVLPVPSNYSPWVTGVGFKKGARFLRGRRRPESTQAQKLC